MSKPFLLFYTTMCPLSLSYKGKYKGKTIFPLLVFNFYCTKMALKARKSTEILRFRCFSWVGEAGLEGGLCQPTLSVHRSKDGFSDSQTPTSRRPGRPKPSSQALPLPTQPYRRSSFRNDVSSLIFSSS